MRFPFFNDDNPWSQLAITVLTCFTCLLVFVSIGKLFSFFLFNIHPQDFDAEIINLKNIDLQKFFQIIEAIGFFLVPSLILGKLFTGRSVDYLKLNVLPSGYKFLLVMVIIIFAFPVIDMVAKLNEMIKFPPSMSGVQDYIDQTSKTYKTISESFMKATSMQGLFVNLFIIAVIPALGEEFLFRGVFQRIFSNMTKSPHWGIFISAFIFSVIHVEFTGFFPRLLLGMMFGYLLFWSGSLWLPILAHFINNAVAVILFYLINRGMINEKMVETGSSSDLLPFSISIIIMGAALYLFYKKRQTT